MIPHKAVPPEPGTPPTLEEEGGIKNDLNQEEEIDSASRTDSESVPLTDKKSKSGLGQKRPRRNENDSQNKTWIERGIEQGDLWATKEEAIAFQDWLLEQAKNSRELRFAPSFVVNATIQKILKGEPDTQWREFKQQQVSAPAPQTMPEPEPDPIPEWEKEGFDPSKLKFVFPRSTFAKKLNQENQANGN